MTDKTSWLQRLTTIYLWLALWIVLLTVIWGGSLFYLSVVEPDVYSSIFREVKLQSQHVANPLLMIQQPYFSQYALLQYSFILSIACLFGFITLTGLALLFVTINRVLSLVARPVKLYQINISGSQGYIERVSVNGGLPLLTALAGKNIELPSGCGGNGTCCQCMVKIPDLNTSLSIKEQSSLSADEIHRGYRLACQNVVNRDLAVEIADPVAAQQKFSARVLSHQYKTPFIKELVLSVPSGLDFTFDAGQYVTFYIPTFSLTLAQTQNQLPHNFQRLWQQYNLGAYQITSPAQITRSYSMANDPQQQGKLTFNIKLALPQNGYGPGVGSSYLFNLQAGDMVDLSGPFGHFVIPKGGNREIILIGGGAGMAPLKSHIDQLLGQRSKRKISLWFGARTELDIFYRQHFDELARCHYNFNWTVSLSRPVTPDWQGAVGHIQQTLFNDYLDSHPAINQCDFLLCGPPAMMAELQQLLKRCGVNDSQIICDNFGM